MEKKEFKQLTDEELNGVNGGSITITSEERLDEESKDAIRYSTIRDRQTLYRTDLRAQAANGVIPNATSMRNSRNKFADVPVFGKLYLYVTRLFGFDAK